MRLIQKLIRPLTLLILALAFNSACHADNKQAIMMMKVNDPLSGMGIAAGSTQAMMMRKTLGENGKAVQYRHCTEPSGKYSVEEEFKGRKQMMVEQGTESETKKIILVDQCPHPANAQCKRNSGNRTDYYYTDSSRVLNALKNECEPKVDASLGKDNPMAGATKKLQALAKKVGGKWTASTTTNATSNSLPSTSHPITEKAKQRSQTTQDAVGLSFFGNRIKDKASILELLKKGQGLSNFIAAPKKYRKDKEFMMAAVKADSDTLKYADPSLLKEKDFVLAAVTQQPALLCELDKKFKKNKEIATAAANNDTYAMSCIDEVLQNDKSFILNLINKKQTRQPVMLSEKMIKDKDVQAALEAFKKRMSQN